MCSSTTSPASTMAGAPGQVAMATPGPFFKQQLQDPVTLIDGGNKVHMPT